MWRRSLIEAIQLMYQNPLLAPFLKLSLPRPADSNDPVTQIEHSRRYREKVYDRPVDGSPSFFERNRRNVCLSLTTDGFNPWRGSQYSMWPVCLSVLNLPPHLRNRPEFTIMIALIEGPDKPERMELYLSHVLREVRDASLHPFTVIDVSDPEPRAPHSITVKLLFVNADLPALCSVLCMTAAGRHGCPKCREQAVHRAELNKSIFTTGYADMEHELRTHATVRANGRQAAAAIAKEQSRRGVGQPPLNNKQRKALLDKLHKRGELDLHGENGASPLAMLPDFDLVRDSCIDVMHILEGAMKHVIMLLQGKRSPADRAATAAAKAAVQLVVAPVAAAPHPVDMDEGEEGEVRSYIINALFVHDVALIMHVSHCGGLVSRFSFFCSLTVAHMQAEPIVDLPSFRSHSDVDPDSELSVASISDDNDASEESSLAADSDDEYVDVDEEDDEEGAAAAGPAAAAAAVKFRGGFAAGDKRGAGPARRGRAARKKSAASVAKQAEAQAAKAAAAVHRGIARAAVVRRLDEWSLSKEQQLQAEALYRRVMGPAGVAPDSHLPFTRAGTLNAYLHLTLARTTGPYLFRCAGFDGVQLQMLLEICELLTAVASHAHTEGSLMNIRELSRRAGLRFGSVMPETEHTIVFHLLFHHVVELLDDWGPAAHTWCFGPERSDHHTPAMHASCTIRSKMMIFSCIIF